MVRKVLPLCVYKIHTFKTTIDMKEHSRILNTRSEKERFDGRARRGQVSLAVVVLLLLFCLLTTTTTTNAFQVPGISTSAIQKVRSRKGVPLSLENGRYRQQQQQRWRRNSLATRPSSSSSSWSLHQHPSSSVPTLNDIDDKSETPNKPLLSFSPQRRNAVIRVSIASVAMFVISNLRNRHKLKLNASLTLTLAVFLAMVERSRGWIAKMRANASKVWQSVEAHYVAGGNIEEEAEQEKARAAEQVTVAGTVVNVFLTLFKLFAGIVGKSSAMVADAGHSLSDLASDVVTLWAVRIARVPADADHPYGHGRFEALGALAVAGMLLMAAVGFGTFAYESFVTMMTGKVMNEAGPTGKIALVAAILSIVSKEIMYRATAVVAQRTESQVLLANAWHHRSDAFSSVVALFSIWGATAGGIPALDPLGGLFVAGMVGITGLRVGWSAFKQLTDTQDFELKAAVERAVEKSIRQYKLQDDVVGYDVKARFLGSRAWVDLEVETNPSRTTSAATQVIKVLRSAILSSIPSVTDVAVLLQAKQDPEVVDVKGDASESPTVTPRQVEANVRKALRNSSAFQGADGAKRLREISSVMTHFSASSTACDVDIIVSADEDSNLSVSEAKKLANIVKDDVIQHADGVVDAKVSLELVRKQEERVSGPEQHYSSDISATLR